ncbi:hypothetical protein AB0284_20220 [Pseudarthrobacter phenanthrenivorans]|uniref:hypothetical protein n=1 Tax=Pseudarthrobacter phenanthrenivorans TaxID=361575 RepID=UPI00344F1E96
MVIDKPLDEGLIQERFDKFQADLVRELFPEIERPGAVSPHSRAFIELRVRASILGDTVKQLQPYVDAFRAVGGTWDQVAWATDRANASSAHSNWGPKRAERTELMRRRQAESRKRGPKEPPPGVNASEAGRILGLDKRTVKSRGEKGEIRTVTVKSSSGRDMTRYILDESPAGR